LDATYQTGDVLVFGSESSGLPDALLETHANEQLRIPIRGAVRSLNLSNAVAVAAYEAQRQWRGPKGT
jgi:tRNA (cytidine/uridine-2'-O-)-methyltransferase